MRYNTELQNNNAELQAILDSVNGLPSAGGENKADTILSLLSGIVFMDVVFPFEELELSFPNIASYNGSITFQGSTGLKKVKLIADNPDVNMSCGNMFATKAVTTYNDDLQIIDLSEFKIGITSFMNSFGNNRELVSILGTLDMSRLTSVNGLVNIFRNCYKLKEVRFAKETVKYNLTLAPCSLLSDTSIQSIIAGLADLTGATAQTLTLHADVKAKLTDAQITAITSKNWTLA